MRLSNIFFLVGLLCTILLFIPFSLIILNYLPQQQEQIIAKQAETIGNYIEQQATSLILVEDYISLNERILLTCENQKNLDFMFVVDNNNDPVASTFEKGVPLLLIQECKNSAQMTNDYKDFTIEKIPYLIFQKPLLQGELGRICFGINLKEIHNTVKINFVIMLVSLFIVLAITLLGSYFIGKWIGLPIDNLAKYAEKVPHGTLKIAKENPFSSSETRSLYRAFQRMVKRIKEADREREEFNNKMLVSERFAAIGTLASGVAHEINNPVAGIEMCIRRLKKTATIKNEKQIEYLQLIAEATHHIKTIVRDLLNYAHQSERVEEKIDLRTVIEFSIKLLQYRIDKRQIKLHVKVPDSSCLISGVMPQLSRIIVNGIMNAVDAIGEKGEINIRLNGENEYYTLIIQDNGKGIPPQIIDRVFEPFFTTKGHNGTGLGLFVSYSMVKAHNGTINILSPPGKGTELVITLPKEKGAK